MDRLASRPEFRQHRHDIAEQYTFRFSCQNPVMPQRVCPLIGQEIHRLQAPMSNGQARPLCPYKEAWAEGPSVIYAPDHWLVYYDKYNKGGYGAVETTDFQTFKPVTVSLPKGIRHGTVLAVSAAALDDERFRQ